MVENDNSSSTWNENICNSFATNTGIPKFLNPSSSNLDFLDHDIKEIINEGFQLKDEGKYKEAIPYFEIMVSYAERVEESYAESGKQYKELDIKGLHNIYNEYGSLLSLLGYYGDSLKFFDKVIKFSPETKTGHFNKGLSLYVLKRTDEAMEEFKKDVENNPSNFFSYCYIGSVFRIKGDYEEAEENLLHSLELCPDYFLPYCELGDLYQAQGLKPLALDNYLKSLSLHSFMHSDKTSSVGRLPSLEGLLSLHTPLHGFQSQNESEREIATICRGMKETFNSIGDINEIRRELETFLNQNPDFTEMNHILALLFDFVGDDTSEEHYSRIIDLMKSNPDFVETLRPYGSSSNPVRVDISSPIAEKMFYIKCNDNEKNREEELERLRKEFATKQFVSDTLKEDNPKSRIEAPMAFFTHQDANIYLITKAEGKRNMRELAASLGYDNPQLEKEFGIVMESLADMQGTVTRALEGKNSFEVEQGGELYRVSLERFDYRGELDKRIFNRFGHNKISEELTEMMLDIIEKNRTGEEFFLHGDFSDVNCLQGGAIIDYERCCMGDPVVDTASVMINPSFDINRKNLFELYFNRLVDASGRTLSYDDFRKSFTPHLIFYSIGYGGSSMFHGDVKGAQNYITAALKMSEAAGLPQLSRHVMSYVKDKFEKHSEPRTP